MIEDCYAYLGNKIHYISTSRPCAPTNSTTPYVACCDRSHECTSDGICHYSPPAKGGSGYYLPGCTDPTYNDDSCPQNCHSEYYSEIVYNSASERWACCRTGDDYIEHCDEPTNETFDAPPIRDLVAIRGSVAADAQTISFETLQPSSDAQPTIPRTSQAPKSVSTTRPTPVFSEEESQSTTLGPESTTPLQITTTPWTTRTVVKTFHPTSVSSQTPSSDRNASTPLVPPTPRPYEPKSHSPKSFSSSSVTGIAPIYPSSTDLPSSTNESLSDTMQIGKGARVAIGVSAGLVTMLVVAAIILALLIVRRRRRRSGKSALKSLISYPSPTSSDPDTSPISPLSPPARHRPPMTPMQMQMRAEAAGYPKYVTRGKICEADDGLRRSGAACVGVHEVDGQLGLVELPARRSKGSSRPSAASGRLKFLYSDAMGSPT